VPVSKAAPHLLGLGEDKTSGTAGVECHLGFLSVVALDPQPTSTTNLFWSVSPSGFGCDGDEIVALYLFLL
jgi:hypothetical protein